MGYDIKKDFVRICNLVQYDEVYIPEDSIQIMDNGRFYAEEYKAIINRIINNCQIEESCFNKIYLTRCGINDGKDYGEKAIENVFKENGYNIISPEKHIFKEQVAIMQSCNKLAATEGSISHNSLFAKDGVEVILLKKANFNNSYQRMINDMKKHKVTYISAHHTIRNRIPWAGPFFLWKTKDFNDYFNINGKYNRWFSVLWYRYVLQSLNYNLIKPIFNKLKFITCSIFKYTERYIKK